MASADKILPVVAKASLDSAQAVQASGDVKQIKGEPTAIRSNSLFFLFFWASFRGPAIRGLHPGVARGHEKGHWAGINQPSRLGAFGADRIRSWLWQNAWGQVYVGKMP